MATSLVWSTVHDTSGESCTSAEEQLTRLAGAVGPLRRVLADIAARLIDTEAHFRLGYARLGDYARERPGLSARQIQELARVHRALGALPALEAALLANELPWSKVRLVARVASGEDEDVWIARARAVSTRRLEQDVRAHDRSTERDDPGDEEPTARLAIRCTPAIREKWSPVREMAQRVAGERLREADALEQVLAEVSSSVPIDPAPAPSLAETPPNRRAEPEHTWPPEEHTWPPEEHTWPPEPAVPARAPARELPAEVAVLAEELDGAAPRELDRRLRLALQLEQTLDAAMAPLLRRVGCAEYEWRREYYPVARYAREQLGMSASKARALVRLERAAEICPELRDAYRSGRLSWVKAQCLLPLLLLDIEGEWRPKWVAWAGRVTVRRLERDVERALLLRAGHHFAWHRCKFHPERAQDPIPGDERQLCAHDVDTEATRVLHFRVPCEVASLFRAVREALRKRAWAVERRPLQDGEAFDAMMDIAVVAWSLRAPGARRPDPVIERDGYQCAIPGCTSRRNLHDHHVVFRSRGGGDEESNRVTLCAFHHQRGVHTGLLRVTGSAPDGLVFEMPLARYRSGDIEIPAAANARRAA